MDTGCCVQELNCNPGFYFNSKMMGLENKASHLPHHVSQKDNRQIFALNHIRWALKDESELMRFHYVSCARSHIEI